MNNSKPGGKLDPALKAILDPIYRHDTTRYARIIKWVWKCQKQGWPDEVIGKTVQLGAAHIHSVNNWWSYLDSLLPKASGRASEDEAARYKRDEMNFLNDLLGPNWSKTRDEQKNKRVSRS